MELTPERRRALGRSISVAAVVGAILVGLLSIQQMVENPRTDDAEVFANFIAMAPIVSGPVMKINVKDNQYVKQGQMMLDIDERPYAYALEQARSEQAALEGNIVDENRRIASESSAVSVSQSGVRSAEAALAHAQAVVAQARAAVIGAQASVDRARDERDYAVHNRDRLQPLLAKQFVTVDQVDRAQTLAAAREQALAEAQAQQVLADAALVSALAQQRQAEAHLEQSRQQVNQAQHSVLTVEPLVAQRSGKLSAVQTAEYNLENCRLYTPFDGRVTNLTISEGAYAHVGQELFTLIDTRTWWVLANFRETQLHHIEPGM